MPLLNKSYFNQTLPTTVETSGRGANNALPMRPLQLNAFVETGGMPPSLHSTSPWSGVNPDLICYAGDFNYSQDFTGRNFDTGAMTRIDDYDPGFMVYMNSNVAGWDKRTSASSQASPILSIDANGGSSSFDQAESTTEPTPNTLSGNTSWTKQEDKFLMSLKAQGLSYSDIQAQMRKEFGWARNKNVLGKRFAVLKKRCKPQIKTRIVRDISKSMMPQIIKAVGKELEKVTSSDSNNVAAELEDLMHLKLPEFLENLAAEVCLSLSQDVDDDDHDFNA